MCSYLIRQHGFADCCRLAQDSGAKSKAAHLRDLVFDSWFVLRNLRRVRAAREVVAIGPMAPFLALLSRLGLLPRCRRLYWFGLFIHDPRWFRILRPVISRLDSEAMRYVVFSGHERELYASALALSPARLLYVPYGDMSDSQGAQLPPDAAGATGAELRDYLFSGGYSNRDYPSLVENFRTLPFELVIVCSALNTEIDESTMPGNVKVLRDLSSDEFDTYLKGAKACIIPIAHDSGAAGQSVLLRCMKYRKAIIATDTGIIREYIADGISGILVKENGPAMRAAIESAIESSAEQLMAYGNAAHRAFLEKFSGAAIARRLDELVAS